MGPFRKTALLRVFGLMLLLTISSQAQNIAEIARQERDRQARLTSVRVYTSQGALPSPPAAQPPTTGTEATPNAPADQSPAAQPGTAAAPAPGSPPQAGTPAAVQPPSGTSGATAAATPTPAAAVPAVDPAVEWNEQMDKMRQKILDLQNQETALQLQVNQLTNQIFATVSDQASRDQAQAGLGETQNRLTAVRMELDQTRKTLDSMNLQGPPKK